MSPRLEVDKSPEGLPYIWRTLYMAYPTHDVPYTCPKGSRRCDRVRPWSRQVVFRAIVGTDFEQVEAQHVGMGVGL